MSRQPALRAPKGFTLVEALVGILLVSIAVPVIKWWHTGGMQGSGMANRNAFAASFIDQEVRELKRRSAALGSLPNDGDYDGSTGTVRGVKVTYTVSRASRADGSTVPNVKRIDFKAAWNQQGGVKEFRTTTFLAKDIPW